MFEIIVGIATIIACFMAIITYFYTTKKEMPETDKNPHKNSKNIIQNAGRDATFIDHSQTYGDFK